MLLYVPPGLVFKISTFCAQGISLFCTGLGTNRVISTHIINGLNPITQKECVYCAVRNESLNTSAVNFVFKGLELFTFVITVHKHLHFDELLKDKFTNVNLLPCLLL